jgi:hypothetical protein
MSASVTPAPSAAVSASFAADEDLLGGFPTSPGEKLRFDEEIWDFRLVEGLAPNLVRSAVVVAWATFANPALRLAAKEVLFAQLHPDHRRVAERVGSRRPLAIRGVVHRVVVWRAWFAWLADNDVAALDQVRDHHWDAYLERRRRAGVTPAHIAVTVARIRDFYDYAPILTGGGYRSRPWGRRSPWNVAGVRRPRENATQPIPDDVFGPLVGAAVHLVEHADTIIAARQVHRDLQGSRWTRAGMQGRNAGDNEEYDRRLRALIDQHKTHGRPLPARADRSRMASEGPNLRVIALWSGLTPKVLAVPHRRAAIAAATDELGVVPAPLVRGFGEPHDHHEVFGQIIWGATIGTAVDLLVAACFIVIALSGMRLEEITAIRRGCIGRVGLRNGDERIRLHGTIYKHQRLGGVPASWVVIEPVAQAVAVLERLAPPGQALLFTPETIRTHPRPRSTSPASVDMGHYLTRFCDWLAGGTLPPRLEPLPVGTRVTARQFRRTMARVLAFRPHGVIAGKVHLKHLHIVMSEGYYGSANSSLAAFHADMEAELAAARVQAAKDRYLSYIDGGGIAGGARKTLVGHFEQIASEIAGFAGTTLEADRHLERLLADRLGKLHIGTVNDCWFIDPDKALCRNGDTAPVAPRPNACVGDRCPNAVVTAAHLPIYQASRQQVVILRRSRKVSDFEKERLAREQKRLERVIQAVEGRP